MTMNDVLAHFDDVHKSGNGYRCRCPAHDDKQPSLMIRPADNGGILVKCMAGCPTKDVLERVGLTMQDLMAPQSVKPHKSIEAVYNYYDANGGKRAEKVRYDDKTFTWRYEDENGKTVWKKPQNVCLLYNLHILANYPKDKPIYIVEGEKDADTLVRLKVPAVCTPDGAGPGKFRSEYIKWFRDRQVIILSDNDEIGRQYMEEEASKIEPVAASVKVLDLCDLWAEMPEHGDISDYIAKFGDEAIKNVEALASNTPVWSAKEQRESADPSQEGISSLKVFSAKELMNQYIPPTDYIVNALLPTGLAILASPPKYGKSWFALDLCVSVSVGRNFLGFTTHSGDAVYMALEDTPARLQSRMKIVAQGEAIPDGLHFLTEAPEIKQNLIEALDKLVAQFPRIKLIVIDTLQMIRGVSNDHENAYAHDYKEMRALKEYADRHNLCVLVIHHTRKTIDEKDPFNRISGGIGIQGVADTTMVMESEKRMTGQTRLSVTGRDVVSEEYTLSFDKKLCKWKMVGNAADLDAKFAKEHYESNEVVQAIREAVALGKGTWRGSMSDLNGVAQNAKSIGHPLCQPRTLSAMVAKLEDDLYRYDGISHSTVQNGTGGRQHIFTQAQVLDKWFEVKEDCPFDADGGPTNEPGQ